MSYTSTAPPERYNTTATFEQALTDFASTLDNAFANFCRTFDYAFTDFGCALDDLSITHKYLPSMSNAFSEKLEPLESLVIHY